MTDIEFTQLIEKSVRVNDVLHDASPFKSPFSAWITRKALFAGNADFLEEAIQSCENNMDRMIEAARRTINGDTPDYKGESDIFVPDAIFKLRLMKSIVENADENQQFCFAFKEESTPAWGWMRTTPVLMRLEECNRRPKIDIMFNSKTVSFEANNAGDVVKYQLIDVIENVRIGKQFWKYQDDQLLIKADIKYVRKRMSDLIYKRDRLESASLCNLDMSDEDIILVINELNMLLEKAKEANEIKTCCQCHSHFVMTNDACKSYINRGLTIPKRCYPCRVANRKEKQ